MPQAARFCTNCGAPLNPDNRFCGSCGHAVEQVSDATPPAAPAQPVQPVRPAPQAAPAMPAAQIEPGMHSEPILGTIANVQKRKGFMGISADTYNLIVTPTRLVFAYVSQQTMKAEVAEANQEAKAQGKNWLGVVGAQMGWLKRLLAKYNSMTIEEILAQYPGSFIISNAEVKKIRLGAPSDEDSNVQGVMSIDTLAGKHSFELVSVQPQDAKRLLQQTLGPLVK